MPIVDDVEITRLVDTAIYYLEKYTTRDARGEIQGLTLWFALINVEHAILCLRLTDSAPSHISGSAGGAMPRKKRKEIRPRKQKSLETYMIGRSIKEITSRLTNVKTTRKDSDELFSELRGCRDVLVRIIRRHSSDSSIS